MLQLSYLLGPILGSPLRQNRPQSWGPTPLGWYREVRPPSVPDTFVLDFEKILKFEMAVLQRGVVSKFESKF